MSAILEPIIAVILRIIGWIFLYILALPILYIVTSPFVLIFAIFGKGSYKDKVKSGFKGVTDFWSWMGPGLP